MSDTTPATETANTPGPGDSSGEPSNPPDGTPTETGAVKGTDPEPSGEEQIAQAYDPSQPVYTGEDDTDDSESKPKGKGKGNRVSNATTKGTRKSTAKKTTSKRAAKKSEPEATVEQGNSVKQTPPK